MGRKSKIGLDYYMCDIGWMMDSKFRRIKQKYGYLAPYTYSIILTMIYKDKGYYIDASDTEELAFNILEYLQGRYMPKAETVMDMIADFVACGLFSRDLFENEHILTSRRIQEEYYNSTSKRCAVHVNKRYWILSVEEMKSISSRSSILSFFISDGINKENDGTNEENDVRSTQRREDKRRAEKTREDETRGREDICSPSAASICLHFKRTFSCDPTTSFVSQIEKYLQEGMTEADIKNDISKAAQKHPDHPVSYVLAMLKTAQKARQPVRIDASNAPLEDWEEEWLEEFGSIKRNVEEIDD